MMTYSASAPFPQARAVALWLWIVCTMIVTMVGVGGITRLTESGLSMVSWQPVLGALPPRTEAQWQQAFDDYKELASTQYEKFSADREMTLSDFQEIFFWEYMHRLLGRVIGLAYALPLAFFLIRYRIPGRWKIRLWIGLLLGGSQGLLGWYMVQSGFADLASVSHFRLAAHLCLALFVLCYLLWMIFDLNPFLSRSGQRTKSIRPLWLGALGVLALTVLQIVYGAFTAGLRAGYTYNTYPQMGGGLLPDDLISERFSSFLTNLVSNPVTVQFIHRHLGLLVVLAVVTLWAIGQRFRLMNSQSFALSLLLGLVGVQFALGLLTLISGMNMALAVSHQVSACFLLGSLMWTLHQLIPSRG
jgi:cytochrome c oxidase assembly protein subunit 15